MSNFPTHYTPIPVVDRAQMIEIDRLMEERYQIKMIQMMENAGRSLAILARDLFLGGKAAGRNVVVLAGNGGNGGGAMAAARRLRNWGASVRVILTRDSAEFSGTPGNQMGILQQMGMVLLPEPPTGSDLIIDGMVGYSLLGAPRGKVADLVHWTNQQITPVLSLDLPTGLEASSGLVHDPCIRASATLTLGLPKTGLMAPKARPMVGELFLADISIPKSLYAAPGINLEVGHIFSEGDILKIR